MKGIILAGGKGTRLRPLTEVTNKHLLPVYNKPMVLYPLETLKRFGIKDILIVTGGEHIGKFADTLGDGSAFEVKLTYKVQTEAGGIAQALLLAEEFAGNEPVTVILGDNIFDKHVVEPRQGRRAVIFTKAVQNPNRFGVVRLEGGNPIEIVEKPSAWVSEYAVTGLYYYPPEVFEYIKTLKPSERGELEITDVNNWFIHRGLLDVQVVDGFWSDAGTFDSLMECSLWAQTNARIEI